MQLRDYQETAKDMARKFYGAGGKKCLLVSPVGSGKTVMFSNIIASSIKLGKKAMVIAHRQELIDQASEKLKAYGVEHGVIMADDYRSNSHLPVQVASIDTLRNRPQWNNWPDFIVIDEAHRSRAHSYMNYLDKCPKAKVLGVTATPYRLDGKGLGDIFEEMITVTTTKRLIHEGHLVPPRIFIPEKLSLSKVKKTAGDYNEGELAAAMMQVEIMGNVTSKWEAIAKDRRTLVFATSVEHSIKLTDRFNAKGYKFLHLDASTPKNERKSAVKMLERHEIDGISNVGLFTEGTDIPPLECVVFARPTLSKALYIQMAGRGLRTSQHTGKKDCIYLDHANLYEEHGSFLEEGNLSLDMDLKAEKKKSKQQHPIKTCDICYAANDPKATICVECGSVLAGMQRQVVEKAAELKEVNVAIDPALDLEPKVTKRQQIMKMRSEEQLYEFARRNGYKEGWVKHIINARKAKPQKFTKPFAAPI